jgi:phosphatidylserine/phosphatidylglycerophosphate/cardiolipin synthase-like enzyme
MHAPAVIFNQRFIDFIDVFYFAFLIGIYKIGIKAPLNKYLMAVFWGFTGFCERLAKKGIINGLMGFEVKKWIWAASGQAVCIEIILDKSNKSKKYSAGDFTAHMGVTTYIDSKHAIAHNKIIIIDKEIVITGSFGSVSV